MARMQVLLLAISCFCLFTLSQFYFTLSSRSTGFSLKLIHRDSPESPLYPRNLTYLERMKRLTRFSKTRGYYLENLLRPNATTEPALNPNLPVYHFSLLYAVQIGIGTLDLTLFLLLDTGNGLTWTQCEPCIRCYAQASPRYDSRHSLTYRKLPCDHPICSGNNDDYRCANGECIYGMQYEGGEVTHGVLSIEQFLVGFDQTGSLYVRNIIFGCSSANQNLVEFQNSHVSGILGLFKSPSSLIYQMSNILTPRFSHCFVPYIQLLQETGVLRFGDDIPPLPPNVQTTSFVNIPGDSLYHLNLLDISVGTTRLGFTPGHFQIRPDGSGGCIIDSGTVLTRIDRTLFRGRDAYVEIMALFQEYYDTRNFERETNVRQGLDLCYKHRPGFNDFVTITYHFEDADYHVDGQYTYFPDDLSGGYFCNAILPGNGMSMLGAWHQQNMRIIYDLTINGLQFAPDNCLNDIL